MYDRDTLWVPRAALCLRVICQNVIIIPQNDLLGDVEKPPDTQGTSI